MSGNGQAQNKAATTLGGLSQLLEKYKDQIANALPKHLTPERMIRAAITAVSQNRKLLECNALTICGSVVQASILGLEPSTVLGECFLAGFWNKKANHGKGARECQLILGHHGKIKLVSNTGELLGLNAKPVHVHDKFEFDDGLEPFVRHKYHHLEDRGPVYGYWAGAALKSGFKRIDFARTKEIEQHRDRFAMTRDRNDQIFGVWIEHFDAMALKTMIHRVCKLLPKSAEAQTAWQLDGRADAGLPQQFSVEVPIELQQTGAFDDTPDPPPDIAEPKRQSETEAVPKPQAEQGELVSQ
ncbi:MAG: recombinase RecT [Bryobacteraceae bacterium]